MAFLTRSDLKVREDSIPCRARSKLLSGSIVHVRYRYWAPPGCRWPWRAAHPWGLVARQQPKWVTKSLLVKRKSLTLAWRRSMSSTKRMPAHPAYNLPEAAGVEAAPAPELAALTLQ
jgi:hypothetical protein